MVGYQTRVWQNTQSRNIGDVTLVIGCIEHWKVSSFVNSLIRRWPYEYNFVRRLWQSCWPKAETFGCELLTTKYYAYSFQKFNTLNGIRVCLFDWFFCRNLAVFPIENSICFPIHVVKNPNWFFFYWPLYRVLANQNQPWMKRRTPIRWFFLSSKLSL